MTTSMPPFDFPSSLQEYATPEKGYLDQHDHVHIICTGAVVFNKEGKLLLVQRAKNEKAFPNLWVDWSPLTISRR
jgi:isopentenyldiphosphate isomerase